MKLTDKEVSTVTAYLESEIIKQHGLSDTATKRGDRTKAREREEYLRTLLDRLQ